MQLQTNTQTTLDLTYCYDLTCIGDVGVHALMAKNKHNQFKFTRFDKDVIDLFRRVDRDVDYYLTPNTFSHHEHSFAKIVGLKANFIDIDTEKHGIDRHMFEGFLDEILEALPFVPKYVIYSGHGYHLVFPYDSEIVVNNVAMTNMWRILEHNILHTLDDILYKYFGVKNICDSKSSDCSRGLRIPGSSNYKNRQDAKKCYVFKINRIRSKYSFFDLCDEFLPDYDKVKTNRHYRRHHSKTNLSYTPMKLKRYRTDDLKKLLDLRDYDLKGMRESFFFIFACNAGYYMSNDEIIDEIDNMNSDLAESLPERELRSLKYEIKKMDLTKWKHRNNRLIDDLEINDDEQKELKTIISKSEKYRRKNKNRSNKRRKSTKSKKVLRDEKVLKLYNQNKSISFISKTLKISRPTLYKIIQSTK